MTAEEFKIWSRRLFVEYPSLWEWVQRVSPDATLTLESWRARLKDYSLAECMTVLEGWHATSQHPFEAYERDKVPMIVRSVADKIRDRAAKQQETIDQRHQYQQSRRNRSQAARIDEKVGSLVQDVVADWRAVFEECRPVEAKIHTGEITREEYQEFLAASWRKHGG